LFSRRDAEEQSKKKFAVGSWQEDKRQKTKEKSQIREDLVPVKTAPLVDKCFWVLPDWPTDRLEGDVICREQNTKRWLLS